eukprot:SRR837773.16984.p1 GENE.SRR837773.16984~~SRR837773.16984.p1  ORF type:complete len:380 (-),score=108.09 SRR837773.16984:135-1118(-)
MKVLVASSITNFMWVSVALFAATFCERGRRGFYLMSTTASAMAYVYPVLLRSDRLGMATVPVVVMWELGGNLAVAVLFHGFVAQTYSPKALEAAPAIRGDVMAAVYPEPAAERSPAQEVGKPQDLEEAMSSVSPTVITDSAGQAHEAASPSSQGRLLRRASRSFAGAAESASQTLRRLGVVFIRTPLVWGIIAGLILNVMNVPFTALPGRAVHALTGAMAPLLYVLLGASLRFNLGISSYRMVFKSLFCRWTANGLLILFIRFVLTLFMPFDSKTIGVMTLCICAPMTTTFVMFSGMHGYKMEQVSMTKNISDIVSLVVMSMLALVV